MLIFFLIFPTLSKNLEFLQEPLTSSGKFAEGVESISSDLTNFSNDLSTTLTTLDSEIDTSISYSSQVGVILIDSQMNSLQIDLDFIENKIKDLEKQISSSYD